jgi:hypothetical protein
VKTSFGCFDDTVQERTRLFMAPDFPHQKNRVQHDTAADDSQQQDAQEE